MPAYQFEALDPQGALLKGVVEADTARAVRAQLRSQGLVPISAEPLTSDPASEASTLTWQARLLDRRAFSSEELSVWTRQLASLVTSGLTLERALTALSDEAESDRQKELVASLKAEVNAGSSFAKALGQHPRQFSEVYVAVVSAGESGGHLGVVLGTLADDLEHRQQLRNKVIAALLYPCIVTLFAICIVGFLMTYVVPQVANVFAGSKKSLPFLTVVMLALSGFLRNWAWLLLTLLAAGAVAWKQCLKSLTFETRHDAFLLTLPILGKLIRNYNATRFAATLSMLTSAGVPILKALQAAADTLSNQAMKSDAEHALTLVREGAPLAQALSQKRRFPSLLSMFARLGEQTGTLPAMLQRAASQLSQDVQRRSLSLATAAEPLLIIGMGIIVLMIVLAVLLPIIELNQWVK